MSSNLLSVNKFCRDNNCCFHFDANQFKIKDLPTGNLLYRGPSKNGLYPLNGVTLAIKPHPHAHFSSVQSTKSVFAQIWHDRLGHPHTQVLQQVLPHVNSHLNKTESFPCTHCIQGKMTKLPFKQSIRKASKPLEVVHSDVWGLALVISNGGARFYVIFVDEYTRFTWFFPISLNFKFFLVSCLLHLLYKICSIIKSIFCILIVGVNMQVMNLIPSVSQMALHMNTLALTLLNKMDSLRESIVTLLTLLSH